MTDAELSGRRTKRQKVDKKGRFAAFERLRDLKDKGIKNKYEVEEVENVYDEVDEREYTKKVLERQECDWIVDDDGCGYVEDGREIFDDDLDDESIVRSSKEKSHNNRKRGRSSEEKTETPKLGGNIRNMLMNVPTKKKKESTVKLESDDILGDIMQELESPHSCVSAPPMEITSPISSKGEMSSREYLRTFATLNSKSKSKSMSQQTISARLPKPEEDVGYTVPVVPEFEDGVVATVKQEPLDEDKISYLVEDFDTNDSFSDSTMLQKMTAQIDAESENLKKDCTTTQMDIKVEDNLTNEERLVKPSNGWETMLNGSANNEVVITVSSADLSSLPLTTTDTGDQVLQFFYWDAYEDAIKQPGTVYLFGKVWIKSASAYVSCCIIVKNIQRRIYLLPREEKINMTTGKSSGEPVSIRNVYEEFNDKIAEKYKILKFKSRKVTKNYAFELADVPSQSEYLEVLYAPDLPMLPDTLSGETFSQVFGTNSSFLELLLLQRKIKGPCWLQLTNPQSVSNPVSWCKIEAVCNGIEDITVMPAASPPPLVVLTVNMRTCVSNKTNGNEIIMISCLVHNEFYVDRAAPKPPFHQHFCGFSKPSDVPFPFGIKEALSQCKVTTTEKLETERALLSFFLARIAKIDPDLVVGHDLQGGDFDILIQRLYVNKIPNWSRIGRLKRSVIPPPGKQRIQIDKYPLCGRLVCDVKISAKELIRARSYDLGTLCQSVLKIKENERTELTMEEIRGMYNSSQSLVQLITMTMQDAAYICRLMCEMNAVPLALQITNIAGNVMSKTLMGGRSERNEYLLLHAFCDKDYITPDKHYKKIIKEEKIDVDDIHEGTDATKKGSRRKKPAYTGGLVLEPKIGFYDKLILLMDFNSLYPSIILEYNICFTTTIRTEVTDDAKCDDVQLPEPGSEQGILPTEIRKLVESRKEVKKLMKKDGIPSDLKLQYDIRQMALKLTANSMYGCLGFVNSRFYAKSLAALITAKGREILMNTRDLVQKLNYEVIYGDTDSLMINTNCFDYDQVFKIGHKIKTEVNKLYKHLELDIDGVFKYMLLLKKKRYAAVSLTKLPNCDLVETQEIKGLDIVRRDWSQLSAEAGKFILAQILSDQDSDERVDNIHAHLQKLKDDLEAGRVPLSLLTITKQLTKAPEDYADRKSQPHVQVALRMNEKGGKLIRAGDTVPYVICEDGTNNSATQRAYHVDELKNSESLKIDIKYYLSQQIHPVISRLCEPIEGTDPARIADCLGLDPNSYKQVRRSEAVGLGESLIVNDEEKYKQCDKFTFHCMNSECNTDITVDKPVRQSETGEMTFILERCPNPNCFVQPIQYIPSIQNKLTMTVRFYIQKYYQGWLICEDHACDYRSRRLPLYWDEEDEFPLCIKCKKSALFHEYTEKDLYTQLSFFQHIFDISKVLHAGMKIDPAICNAYGVLHEHVGQILSQSAYSVINLTKLFNGLFPTSFQIKEEPKDSSCKE